MSNLIKTFRTRQKEFPIKLNARLLQERRHVVFSDLVSDKYKLNVD